MLPRADPYLLGYSRAEQERLQRQAEELAADSQRLFDQIGLEAGARVVEIGCGPRGCLDLLAERVGPTGTVAGVERSEYAVILARKFLADHKLTNVQMFHRDARETGLERGAFDLVTSRLVLVNVPEPEQIVSEMVALARPEGVVTLHDADWITCICDPPLEAWDRLAVLIGDYSRANGVDLFIGRKAPRLLRKAGLVDVQVHPMIHVYPPGHPRRTLLPEFTVNLRDRILSRGAIGAAEFDDLIGSVKRHADNQDTLMSHVYVQCWGRKPAAA